MRRLSDEDGRSARARNYGRLALFLIPAALGGAAVLWILAASGFIDLSKTYRAEQRVLNSVGMTSVPAEPIAFETHDAKCLKIDAASMRDGNHFVFYARNTCAGWLNSPAYSYRLNAGDGTAIASNRYAFGGDRSIGPTERREQVVWIQDGIARVTQIRIDAID